MRLAFVVAATVAGAALFAALHPAPRDAYEAAGALVVPVHGVTASELEARTRQAAEVLREPSVMSEALERSLQESEPQGAVAGLRVAARPDAGVAQFSVRAASQETATRLGEQLGRVALETLQRGLPSGEVFGARIVGDFEFEDDGWAATGTDKSIAVAGRVPGGRYGGASLRVRCTVPLGCGTARVLEGRYPAGRRLTMTAWLRARMPSRILLRLGAANANDDARKQIAVGRRWQRVVVGWRPKHAQRRISLAVNDAGPGRSDVDMDGVVFLTGRGPLTANRERRLFTEHSYAYAAPVRVVASRTGRTVRWAAIGAGLGLVVSLVGVFAATLAARRRLLSA